MFDLYWLQVISFVFADDLSPCVTYDRLLASAAWWMPLVEQDLIYHLEPLCLAQVLMVLLFAQTLVSNVNHCLPFVLSLSLFHLCPSVCWFWLHRCCLPIFLMLIGSQSVIVFITEFIFCSYLYSNKITSIQEGAFNNLTSLTYM
jgi:hypothetical protein